MTLPAARLGSFIAIVITDQVSKACVVAFLPPSGEAVPLGAFVNLVHVRNYGIGFGLLGGGGSSQQWILAAFAVAVAAGLLVLQARTEERLYAWGLLLIAGGAVGNAICRIARGSVVDFVDVHVAAYHWPAFNVADSAITVGAMCVIALSLPLRQTVDRLRSFRRGR